jgi:hypothetical protein
VRAQPVEARPSRLKELNQWLANPLLVTVVAALLVNWLIPQVTRKWQDHQKALEIKTGLVSEMSQSVSRAVMTGRFLTSGLIRQSSADPRAEQRAWNQGFQDWTTTSASIGARLEAYISGNDAAPQWRTFSNVVTDFFQLSANVNDSRVAQVREILTYPALPKDVQLSRKDWVTLASASSGAAFQRAYAELGRGILERRDELVHTVLDSGVSGF